MRPRDRRRIRELRWVAAACLIAYPMIVFLTYATLDELFHPTHPVTAACAFVILCCLPFATVLFTRVLIDIRRLLQRMRL